MSIAALVITYHPDHVLLKKNVAAFVNDVDEVIVWRNSPEPIDCLSEWKHKITFMGMGKNDMIAYPVNNVISYCKNKNYNYLLTMDQDSCWQNFHGFVEAVMALPKDNTVGIYAPNVNNYLNDPAIAYKDIEWVIQSGMLINMGAIDSLGGFREDYGIYGIDEEFCYWLRLNGKKIRSFTNFHLTQRYGDAYKSRFGFYVFNYSPFVRYHLIRNMIWMKREFPKSTIVRRILHVIFDNYRDIILVESNKFQKVKAFTKGILHGCFKHIPSRR